MQKRHKSRILESEITRCVDRLNRHINTSMDVLAFMRSWNDDEIQIIEFAKQRLARALSELGTLEDRVGRLADAADPGEPEDLPF